MQHMKMVGNVMIRRASVAEDVEDNVKGVAEDVEDNVKGVHTLTSPFLPYLEDHAADIISKKLLSDCILVRSMLDISLTCCETFPLAVPKLYVCTFHVSSEDGGAHNAVNIDSKQGVHIMLSTQGS